MKGTDRYFVRGVSCNFRGAQLPVVNMSVGGFFVASERLPLSDPVLEMELTIGRWPPFRVLGRVVWVNDPVAAKAPDLPTGFGVQITKIGFTDKLAILDMLRRAPDASRRKPEAEH